MLPLASPLQALQLIDGADQLALNRCFVAEDAVEVSTQRQTEMVPNCVPGFVRGVLLCATRIPPVDGRDPVQTPV
jgi:hypothetical protein